MIDLYTWKTPNGRKVSIVLEEMGLPYEVRPVDLSKKAQFEPDFLAISPNNKIPAIVDRDGPEGGPVTIFESGAILTYLAEKTGRLLPTSGAARFEVLEWLHWQIGGLGPTLGQFAHFAVMSKEKVPPAIDRFGTEVGRLLGVAERRLAASAFLGGAEYSIADIAAYPWLLGALTMMRDALGEQISGKPALQEWMARIGERPAVQAGMKVPE